MYAIPQIRKSFSGSPIDLVLQQAINANAACQRTKVSAPTNSIYARQGWEESHFLCTTIISKVFEDLGLTKKEDAWNNVRPHWISNDQAGFNKV